ncbi:Uroporphyrinogen III synthase HEM4 [Sphingomonas antarctica]|uniref:uroporphyrinogen-III synthase n=1 Tax=Sphingomonas antarctica TaxID=2040274 RepID=UPI0039EAB9C1
MIVIILRPQPGADATAARARALGLQIVVAPLFEIQPMAWIAPDPAAFDALLLTSASGVRAAGEKLMRFAHLPVVTVGEATADAARGAGLDVTQIGEGDGASVVAASRYRHFVHLAGRRHVPLDSARVTSVAVYAAEALPPPKLPATGVALLHSARAARRFGAIVHDRAAYALVAISPGVAEAAGSGWRAVVSAGRPADAAMLAMAASLCEDPDHGV